MESPLNLLDLLWWAFNALWLIVMGLVCWIVNGIKLELRDLKHEIKAERRFARWLVNVVLAMRTRCAMMHPDKPMPDMPAQPEDE